MYWCIRIVLQLFSIYFVFPLCPRSHLLPRGSCINLMLENFYFDKGSCCCFPCRRLFYFHWWASNRRKGVYKFYTDDFHYKDDSGWVNDWCVFHLENQVEIDKITKPLLDALGDEYDVPCQGTYFTFRIQCFFCVNGYWMTWK